MKRISCEKGTDFEKELTEKDLEKTYKMIKENKQYCAIILTKEGTAVRIAFSKDNLPLLLFALFRTSSELLDMIEKEEL